jgi:phenylalanyl-tRNA synthetase beta chain
MPTISIPKKELFEAVGTKLTPAKLQQALTSMGIPLEAEDDKELTLEVTANRPDLLSFQGIARYLASYLGLKQQSVYKAQPPKENYRVIIDSSVKKVRPYTACAIAKSLSLNDEKIRELIQIQEKLHVTFGRNRKKVAIGIYPLEFISLPIHYKADKPEKISFAPLGFSRKMTGMQILQQHPAGKEYAGLLERKTHFPFFIDSKGSILSMPPIINSDDTGKISRSTKEAFIECSGFDMDSVMQGVSIISCALLDMGAKVFSMKLCYPDKEIISPRLEPHKIKLDLGYVERYLGIRLSKNEISSSLRKTGLEFNQGTGQVMVPPYRTDILHQIDIVEEIAIGYGYSKLPSEPSPVFSVGKESPTEILKKKVREIMASCGLIEAKNYYLTGEEYETSMVLKSHKLVHLKNSMSSDFNVLRRAILPGLLRTLQKNKHHDYPQELFEQGTAFIPKGTGIIEEERLACILCSKEADYTRIRQVLDTLLRELDIKADFSEKTDSAFIEGRCAEVSADGKVLGHIGEVSPEVLDNFSLEMPASAFEVSISTLKCLIEKRL